MPAHFPVGYTSSGVKSSTSNSYTYQRISQANICERVNRNIRYCLLAVVKAHKPWDQFLLPTQYALNSAVQHSSGYSASALNLGREMKAPIDWIFIQQSKEMDEKDIHSLAGKLKLRVAKAILHARENIIVSNKTC